MEFVERIKAKAAEEIKIIVLPEAAEERNIKAANQIIKEGFAKLVLATRTRSTIWPLNITSTRSVRLRSSIPRTILKKRSTLN